MQPLLSIAAEEEASSPCKRTFTSSPPVLAWKDQSKDLCLYFEREAGQLRFSIKQSQEIMLSPQLSDLLRGYFLGRGVEGGG